MHADPAAQPLWLLVFGPLPPADSQAENEP